MGKRGLYLSFIIALFLILIPFISANFGYDNPNLPRIDPAINYTEIINWVNDTSYWAGHPWSDTRWLNIDGSNANQNIDIEDYDFSASGGFLDNLNVTGNWCNETNCYTLSDFLTGAGGGMVFDQWVNTTSNVSFSNLNASGYGIFAGDYNKTELLGYGNVRLGSYSGTTGWGTITLETNFGGVNSLWTIDNGGAGIRIYETTIGADQYSRFRITNTTITLGEAYYGREIDLDITGNTIARGNVSIDGNFSVNNSALFVNQENDFVGIGTTSPSHPLSIQVTSEDAVKISDATNNATLQLTGNGGIRLSTSAHTSTTLYGFGVGMDPIYALDVVGTIRGDFFRALAINNYGSAGRGSMQLGTSGVYIYRSLAEGGYGLWVRLTNAEATGNILLLSNNVGYVMAVKQDGKVGINTTTPQNPLNVIGITNSTLGFAVQGYSGYSGYCVNTTYVGGIAISCND